MDYILSQLSPLVMDEQYTESVQSIGQDEQYIESVQSTVQRWKTYWISSVHWSRMDNILS
jgi:hypothetical protein